MAGNVKVGGNVIATHTGVEGAGTVTLSNVTASGIKMSSSGNTITDSAGNAVLSESSGTVNINKGTLGSAVNLNSPLSSATFPAGHVIQTVYNQTNTPTNITGTSGGSGTTTGLSVNITPTSTSNKLLIIYRGSLSLAQHANPAASVEIHDGSSVVISEDGSWGVYVNGNGDEYDNQYHYTLMGFITPSSAGSAITYTVRAWKYGNNCTFQSSNRTSDILIQEIKQ